MTEIRRCPKCGAELPPDAPQQPCPACLMQMGLASWAGGPAAARGLAETSPAGAPAGFQPPPVEQLAPRFPQLELLEPIGKGGMGAVYKARQLSLDRLVALKVINPESARDPSFAERFAREAKALARLNHPHIVTVQSRGPRCRSCRRCAMRCSTPTTKASFTATSSRKTS
jgi:hypothetical protein